jgi:hypothetical protein
MSPSLSAEAYGGLERAVRPRLGHGDQALCVGQAHVRPANPAAGHGDAVDRAARVV